MALDHYVTLGRSGLRVSPFALGAMTFGDDPVAPGPASRSPRRSSTTYLDLGGNFIDTANFYTNGHSEKILGDFFAAQPRAARSCGARVEVLHQHVSRRSERRRRRAPLDHRPARREPAPHATDYLDLYWLHNWDRHTPIEETMRTLDDLVRAGKIRYIGFSNTPAWVTAQAQTTALLKGWTPLIALQVEYSLLARTVEGELAPLALDQGMALVPWSPLKQRVPVRQVPARPRRSPTRPGRLSSAARARTSSWSSTSSPPSPTSSGPPRRRCRWPGYAPAKAPSCRSSAPRRLDHLENNLAGLDVSLTPEHLRALDEVSAPTLNYPAPMHGDLRAMLQFAGTTVDGQTSGVYPPLLQSDVRY